MNSLEIKCKVSHYLIVRDLIRIIIEERERWGQNISLAGCQSIRREEGWELS